MEINEYKNDVDIEKQWHDDFVSSLKKEGISEEEAEKRYKKVMNKKIPSEFIDRINDIIKELE